MMKYILLTLTVLLICNCKPSSTTEPVSAPATETTSSTLSEDERLEIKKLLRELNNLENSIQGAAALSQIAKQRSDSQVVQKLATVVTMHNEDVLTSISSLSASTTVTIPETRNSKARSVEQAFTTMPVSELDVKYKDWVTKFTQRLDNSYKSIAKNNSLEKTKLLKALSAYNSSIRESL